MLNRQNPTQTKAWAALKKHHAQMKKLSLADLFQADKQRFEQFSLQLEDILVDFSKNNLTKKTIDLLTDLARQTKVEEAIQKMFSGEAINETEDRAVLHVALRNRSDEPVFVDGKTLHDLQMVEGANLLEQKCGADLITIFTANRV